MSLFRVVVVIISPGFYICPAWLVEVGHRQPECNVPIIISSHRKGIKQERRRKRTEQDGRERKKDCLSRQLVVSRADQTRISDRSCSPSLFLFVTRRKQQRPVWLFLSYFFALSPCVDYTLNERAPIVPLGPPPLIKTFFVFLFPRVPKKQPLYPRCIPN